MNHIFKKIWNKSLGCMVVVSERAKSGGKTHNTTGTVAEVSSQAKHKTLILKGLVLSIAAISGSNVWAGAVCDTTLVTNGTTATGNNAIACGNYNNASGINSTAMGYSNTASEDYSNAVGSNNTTTAPSSNAIGISNKASGQYSSAIGYKNTTSYMSSSALGNKNTASNNFSSALGFLNTASGTDSSAVGSRNTASAENSSVFGSNSQATAIGATAIGNNSLANEANTVSVGKVDFEKRITNVATATKDTDAANKKYVDDAVLNVSGASAPSDNYAHNNSDTALGAASGEAYRTESSVAEGITNVAGITVTTTNASTNIDDIDSFTLANGTKITDTAKVAAFKNAVKKGGNLAIGENSSALGNRNNASNTYSSAIGYSNTASGSNSSAVGFFNTASGGFSSAVGFNNTASGNSSSALGSSNQALGENSSAVGSANKASGGYDTAVGFNNTASEFGASSVGFSNIASGVFSSAVGFDNTASAENSSVFGSNSQATAEGATAIGNDSVADEANTISVGKAGFEKRITNVATAITATDAANKGYVDTQVLNISNQIGTDNFAYNDTSAALGGSTGYAYSTKKSEGKIIEVAGVTVTTTGTGDSIDDIDSFTLANGIQVTDAAQVAAFKNAAKKGGNLALGANSSAMGVHNISSGMFGSALGYDNKASGMFGSALGNYNKAEGNSSSAIGSANTASGIFDSAVGFLNTAEGGDSSAIGNRNTAKALVSSAIGSNNTTSGYASSAVGYQNIASSMFSNALGSNNKASGDSSSALGSGNIASSIFSNALGSFNIASGENSSAIGSRNLAKAKGSTAVGAASGDYYLTSENDGNTLTTVNGISVTATGTSVNSITQINGITVTEEERIAFIQALQNGGSVAFGSNSSTLGNQNLAIGDNSSAVGFNNTALNENSSVFGSNSQAKAAGATAIGNNSLADEANTISVGKKDAEKRITNVATATKDTDAANKGYVDTTFSSVANAVLYDSSTKDSITLAGTTGTKISNLQDATLSDTSTDAVTGKQLSATNLDVTALDNRVTTGLNEATTDRGAIRTEFADADTAIRSEAATETTRVNTALNDATTDRGTIRSEFAAADTVLTNKITANTNDITGLKTGLGGLANAVSYDSSTKDSIILAGTTGTKISNLKDAALNNTSTDAVTGKQLNATNLDVTALDNRVTTGLNEATTDRGAIRTEFADADTALSNRITVNADDITGLKTGLGGLANAVSYDSSTKDSITLAGTTGTKISNLQDATLSDTSTEAVTGKQLFAAKQNAQTTNTAIVTALGGGAAFNNGVFNAPNYKIQDGQYTNVGSALTAVDGQLTLIKGSITDLKNYVDTQDTAIVSNSTEYTDQKATDAAASLKNYTDQKVTDA